MMDETKNEKADEKAEPKPKDEPKTAASAAGIKLDPVPQAASEKTYAEKCREAMDTAVRTAVEDAEAGLAKIPAEKRTFNVMHKIRTDALAGVKFRCMIETPNNHSLLLRADDPPVPCGEWVELDGNQVEVLKAEEGKGKCTAIIRPPGWRPA